MVAAAHEEEEEVAAAEETETLAALGYVVEAEADQMLPLCTTALVPPAAGEAAATQLPLSSPEVSRCSVPAITCPAIYRASQKVYCADLCRTTTVNDCTRSEATNSIPLYWS